MPTKSNKAASTVRKPRKKDPRVDRSTVALGAAFIALMQERAFDSITVQDVLDRAGVARSTFYKHFRDTNDLFLSDFERLLRHLDAAADKVGPSRLLPVAEMLEHFGEMQLLFSSLRQSGRAETVREIMTAQFARTIERRAAVLGYGREQSPALRTASVFCAGALSELCWWWLNRGADRPAAAAMDARFHAMAWGGLQNADRVPAEAFPARL